jgi:hypothetical protein
MEVFHPGCGLFPEERNGPSMMISFLKQEGIFSGNGEGRVEI